MCGRPACDSKSRRTTAPARAPGQSLAWSVVILTVVGEAVLDIMAGFARPLVEAETGVPAP